MKKEILYPDYNHSTLNLINSILKHYNVDTKFNGLNKLDDYLNKQYKNVVLVILDGMGSSVLKNLSPNGIFSNNKVDDITTIYPSTTAAAMNMYYSGKPPIETGYIAFTQYFKEYNRTLEMLSHNDAHTGEKVNFKRYDVFKEDLNYEPTYAQIQKASPDTQVYEIKPTHCDKHTSKCVHIEDINDICESIVSLCTNNEKKYVFAYFDKPDKLLHRNGCSSDVVKDFILETEATFNKMYEELKGTDTLVIVCADHGHIDIHETYNILEMPEILDLLYMPPSFEHRLVSFNVKEERKNEFKKIFENKFKDSFILYSKEEFLNSNLLGFGNKHKKVDDFLGDYIAVAISDVSIKLETYISKEKYHKITNHCGLTKEEMEVPLIVLDCK